MGNWCYNPTNRNPLKSHLYIYKLVVFEAHLGNFLSQGARGSASPPTSTAAHVAETKKRFSCSNCLSCGEKKSWEFKGLS